MGASSARMVGRSERRSRAKWAASLERVVVSSSWDGIDVEVVSQTPGICGAVASGRWEMDV